jgi:hypothetical protein
MASSRDVSRRNVAGSGAGYLASAYWLIVAAGAAAPAAAPALSAAGAVTAHRRAPARRS